MAYLGKSFLGLALGTGAVVVFLVPDQTVGHKEDTTSTP